jgi:hypothetical protein
MSWSFVVLTVDKQTLGTDIEEEPIMPHFRERADKESAATLPRTAVE